MESHSEITFSSSDGVLFSMQRAHLEVTTAGFPSYSNLFIDKDPVALPEHSSVLEILFRFIRPPLDTERNCQPDLSELDEQLFFNVAEAAEKYMVYGAMNTSTTYMLHIIDQYPLQVLNHAAKHGYSKLSNKAAQLSLTQPDLSLAQSLTQPGVLNKFLIYRTQYTKIKTHTLAQLSTLTSPGSQHSKCARIYDIRARYLEQTMHNPQSVTKLPTLNEKLPCTLMNKPRGSNHKPGAIVLPCHLPSDLETTLVKMLDDIKPFSDATSTL